MRVCVYSSVLVVQASARQCFCVWMKEWMYVHACQYKCSLSCLSLQQQSQSSTSPVCETVCCSCSLHLSPSLSLFSSPSLSLSLSRSLFLSLLHPVSLLAHSPSVRFSASYGPPLNKQDQWKRGRKKKKEKRDLHSEVKWGLKTCHPSHSYFFKPLSLFTWYGHAVSGIVTQPLAYKQGTWVQNYMS